MKDYEIEFIKQTYKTVVVLSILGLGFGITSFIVLILQL